MSIEQTLTQHVKEAVRNLYGTEVNDNLIQIQKTKKEFEGNLTLVVFPFVKLARKVPEQVGTEIGDYLQAHAPEIEKYHVVKGFLNLSISSA